MNKLQWYIHRLKVMPPAELPYRLIQALKVRYDKSFTPIAKSNFDTGCLQDLKPIDISFVGPHSSQFIEPILGLADDALSHRYSFFNITCDFGDPINWSLDPKTGNSWPIIFWNDIDHRDSKTVGGIKFAWELNRLHHWPILALAYRLSGKEKYKYELFNQIRSWLDANPYPKGINWISGIELGIRVVNLTYALRFICSEPLTSEQEGLVCRFISLHGRHQYRFHSKYSSCNNHAIAEALGCFTAGISFPTIPGADKWKRFGKSVLEREVLRQIYPDGSSFEHSTGYLQFVLDHYLIYYLLCKEYGETCGESVKERLVAAFGFIYALITESGDIPSIGDSDDGYLVKLSISQQNNYLSLLNTGAVLFNRPEWIIENSQYDLKTHCLLGTSAEIVWCNSREKITVRGPEIHFFSDAGLACVRTGDPSNIVFVENIGPLGCPPLFGHGHADALSFILTVGGRQFIVDPGTYLYHNESGWRSHFRSTSAHSTIRIDQQDQSQIVTDFMFEIPYFIRNASVRIDGDNILLAASHDGYSRLDSPLIHERRMSIAKDGKDIVIDDFLYSKGEHFVECYFHFHPECRIKRLNNVLIASNGDISLQIMLDEAWGSIKLLHGQSEPWAGWYSSGFNNLEQSTTIVCSGKIVGNSSFRSVIHLDHRSIKELKGSDK